MNKKTKKLKDSLKKKVVIDDLTKKRKDLNGILKFGEKSFFVFSLSLSPIWEYLPYEEYISTKYIKTNLKDKFPWKCNCVIASILGGAMETNLFIFMLVGSP